ncbi:hypothetical protein H6A07_06865 [Olsenella uli]|uniref:hypothetical protein n=1 Tax=Olsenella uli TaxID=133926 RepID=UPI00195AB129|nr:hypothetical protein [Olsenella uli]MBM6676463.1 hypothetical protein [Olsenella uli]
MDRHTLEQFRTRARKVTLPEDVRESVLDEIRVDRGERARGPRRPRRERRVVTRRTFVRVGAVAAGGVVAFLGANALVNHAAGKRGNWFALTAYAEGTEEPDGSRLALGETFGGHISWAGGVDPESDGDDLLMVHTELNLSCTGDNVDTLTYQLEGDSVGPSVDVYFKPGIWIFQSDYEGSGPVANFTVDYDSQDTQSLQALLTGRLAYYAVYANIPVPDDLVPVFLEMQEISETVAKRSEGSETIIETDEEQQRNTELRNQVGVRVAELFAEELAKTTLVMTATFNDGSEQTKHYSFSPREDYTQIYADYLEEDWEAYLAGDDARRTELTQNPPSLYLITETAG